ncbi:glycoside hydrolase family 16 protein [Auriculariales sp. MPI-PUGE-AT-0066]|nr:glycoside hydrolase family 16 protein [Auriculariales sp. MPI-PUGE-AT-0066]
MFTSTYITLLLAFSASALAAPGKHKGKHHHHHSHSSHGSCTETSTSPPTSTPTGSPQPPPIDCSGNCYKESKNYVGASWLESNDWDFFDQKDPTHGRVAYVNQDRAKEKNLTYTSDDTLILRTDSSVKLESGGKGRESIRISSKQEYTTHVSVIDVRHMPVGPGTWPAFWMTARPWPDNGELDIIEGVDGSEVNLSSLHTTSDCTQPTEGRKMTGDVGHDNCDAKVKGNQGCGVSSNKKESWGPAFNDNNGGWFATERTDQYIKVWFWSRDSSDVPADVRDNTGSVGPDSWGKPVALFVSDSCDLSKKFSGNVFVINNTLCGDWAGNKFKGGKEACEAQVNNHPEKYKDAYWNIARLSIYEQ